MDLLYLVPETANDPTLAFHGSTKDVASLRTYFAWRGFAVAERGLPRRTSDILRALKSEDLKRFQVIVLSLPGSHPRVLSHLKRNAPQALILFRAHNAEVLHRLDWMLASEGIATRLRLLSRMGRALVGDLLSARVWADNILAISEADARQYWHRLGGARRVTTVPYFLDRGPVGRTDGAKERLCLGLTALLPNPLVIDATRNFCRMVERLGPRAPDWRFALAGAVEAGDDRPERMELRGTVEDPLDALVPAKAMVVLSDYGRGFKTKILEAVQARCRVLVTPGLYDRLPGQLQPFAIRVRKDCVEDFVCALRRCDEPWPAGDPNADLRKEAFEAMESVLRWQSPPAASVESR